MALLDMPSEYYKVLRFVVVAACIAQIVNVLRRDLSEAKRNALVIAFGLLAVVFNPIMPLYLEREQWMWFNLAGVVLFGWSSALLVALGRYASAAATTITRNWRETLALLFFAAGGLFVLAVLIDGIFFKPNRPQREEPSYGKEMLDKAIRDAMKDSQEKFWREQREQQWR